MPARVPAAVLAVRKVADRYTSRMARAFLDAVALGEAALDDDLVAHGIETGNRSYVDAATTAAMGVFAGALNRTLPPLIGEAMAAAGNAAAGKARLRRADGIVTAAANPLRSLRFDLTNQRAVDYIRTRGAALVTRVSERTRRAIRSILERSFTQGFSAREAARLIRERIGLSAPQSEALWNLREAIKANPGRKVWAGSMPIRVPAEGASREFIERRAAQYRSRLLNQRAITIAQSESMAASNAGQLDLWRQAIDKGLLYSDVTKRWIETPDERLCDECASIAASGDVPINEPFPGGFDGPPAHIFCRCGIGISGRSSAR